MFSSSDSVPTGANPGLHRVVPARTHRLRPVEVDHQDRCQIAEQVLQTSRAGHLEFTHDVVVHPDPHAVDALIKHRLHEGRGGQFRRVDDQPAGQCGGDGAPDGRVGLPDDHAFGGVELLDEQGQFKAA